MTYRKLLPILALAFVGLGCGDTSDATDQAVVEAGEPVNVIAAELMANKTRFIEAMSGLTAEQWTYQESPDRWSIAMVAEHLVKTEESSLGGIRDGVLATDHAEPQANPDSIDGMIVALLGDRSQQFQAPDNLQPDGIYATPQDAIDAFTAARDSMISLAEDHGDVLRHHSMDHPIGMALDGHQWMLFVKAHADRHLEQVAQVKGHEGYPAAE